VRNHKAEQHRGHATDQDKTITSTLERENSLLGLALSAERRGDGVRAHGLFQALLTQYPASVLIPEAQAGFERTRPH
jgi:hypothetical protein